MVLASEAATVRLQGPQQSPTAENVIPNGYRRTGNFHCINNTDRDFTYGLPPRARS